MMNEITYCISKWTVAFIIPFSGREKVLVNSQKLPFGWERDLLFLDFSVLPLIKLPVTLTYPIA